MTRLKPGATYIYERADGVTYAREFGEVERFPIGWDAGAKEKLEELQYASVWSDIKRTAKSNPTLQEALDRVKILYELSKNDAK
jgi:hypothetical protein